MTKLVEYCVGNGDVSRRKALRRNVPGVRERYCLEHCGPCARKLFVLVDGEIVDDEAYDRIVTALTVELDDHESDADAEIVNTNRVSGKSSCEVDKSGIRDGHSEDDST